MHSPVLPFPAILVWSDLLLRRTAWRGHQHPKVALVAVERIIVRVAIEREYGLNGAYTSPLEEFKFLRSPMAIKKELQSAVGVTSSFAIFPASWRLMRALISLVLVSTFTIRMDTST